MRVLFKTSSKNHEVQLLLKWLKTEDMQNSDVSKMHMTNWSYYDKEMEQEWLHWKSCEAAI